MKTLLTFAIVLSGFCCWSQTTIKGVVFDKKGPLPGVVVVEEGSGNMVMTNARGEFQIITNSNKPELNFSYIGFLTAKVRKGKVWRVKMKLEKPKGRLLSVRTAEPSVGLR